MAATNISETYSVKFQGKVGDSSFSKTISNIDENSLENTDTFETIAKDLDNVLDSGSTKYFTLVMNQKFEVA